MDSVQTKVKTGLYHLPTMRPCRYLVPHSWSRNRTLVSLLIHLTPAPANHSHPIPALAQHSQAMAALPKQNSRIPMPANSSLRTAPPVNRNSLTPVVSRALLTPTRVLRVRQVIRIHLRSRMVMGVNLAKSSTALCQVNQRSTHIPW